MKEIKTFQGSSIYTKQKEFEIGALTKMRLTQFKSSFFKHNIVIVADVFSGTGRNVVDDELIEGSPVRIMDGVINSGNTKTKINYFFSDIRPNACEQLSHYLLHRFNMSVKTHAMAASDAINMLGNILHKDYRVFLFLVLDPNGPKDFPKNEVYDILKEFPRRIDVIPNISATAISRCLGARYKAGHQMQGWLGTIDNFDEGFVSCLITNNRNGWIRKPVQGDIHRWVIIPTFGVFKPRNNWEKQGYIDLATDEGKELVKFYCGSQLCKR
jgi:hypothetical protein